MCDGILTYICFFFNGKLVGKYTGLMDPSWVRFARQEAPFQSVLDQRCLADTGFRTSMAEICEFGEGFRFRCGDCS